MNTETHTRTWVRVLLYKAVAFAITAVWAGVSGALAIQVILTIVQVAMERAWLKVNWGLKNVHPEN
jgi:ABC-type branched-subunit amino acid transport system permease subunit